MQLPLQKKMLTYAYFVLFVFLKGSPVTQKGKIPGNTKTLHISNHIQDMKCYIDT